MLKQRVGADLVILLCFCFTLQSISQKTHPLEVRALLAVQRKLVDPMNHLASWNRGDPCTSNWTGVLCFSGTDNYFHIRNLHLLNMNLSGVLSPGIGQLSHLRILDFMWNDLTGTIPREIGYMTSLELLLLNGNKLSGPLPDELGYLSNLNRLQVDLNQISGPIPKSFANMTSVKHFHMNNNSLSGEVPSELSRLPSLLHLLVDNNNLSGNLPPEFSNFPELRILQLDNNNFRGEIPVTYGNFTALVKLSLRNCSLEGPIRDLSTIQNLSYLDLSWNRFSGPIPSNKLSENVTTIDLSYNNLNGSIPESFSDLPFLQRLSLKNNSLAGSVSAKLWKNMSFTTNATLQIDLRNNLFSNILGDLIPPANVSLRLAGNPICKLLSVENSGQFCGPESEEDELHENSLKSNPICHVESCPVDAFFEYVVASPASCFCALPLRIGYRLKSPSFSYFPPYQHLFEQYVTDFLKLNLYQLSIGSYVWEGCRLTMYLKIFPPFNLGISVFNKTEEKRIIEIYTSWTFPQTDLFGPYELLNYTVLDPFSNSNTTVSFVTRKARIGGGILAAIMLGAIVCVGLIAALIIFVRRGRVKNQHSLSRKSQSSKIGMKIDGVKSFTLKEMVLATGNFKSSSQVGQGGYGKVYRGILWDNSTVAIKRAAEGSLQGTKEFFTEIELLSRLHHRNLVSLIGYCDEDEEQMLVYEFMSNGTLRSWLSGKSEENLSFGMRLQIALGSAKGILYLHSEANPPIFHRDIKATNILLDDRLNAKVADFGLSRLAPVLDDEGFVPRYISTVVKGTPGYLDPEYFLTHKLTDKSDVYSLGVVFLEILTGMQPISHGKNIVREVNMAHQMGTMFSIIDSRMGSFPSECVEKFVALALACCHDKPEERPCMLDVVRELENIAKMMPEDGSTFFSSECSQSIVYNTGSNLASASTSASGLESLLSKDPSISISGSDLVSGVEPTINPR